MHELQGAVGEKRDAVVPQARQGAARHEVETIERNEGMAESARLLSMSAYDLSINIKVMAMGDFGTLLIPKEAEI